MKPTEKLADVLKSALTKHELTSLIQDLFTESEIDTVIERWNVFILLLEGHTHREVQTATGVSISKVTHAANLLKTGGGKGVRLARSHGRKHT